MTYLSVCSGIEAASVAWQPLGWTAVAFAEVEAFPSAVLAHHYPYVPNRGDVTRFKEWPDAVVNVLVGGTPCQSFSVAGLRAGLADPRGNLALTYLAIADRYRPRWLVWENVPGVLSSAGGRDFGAFLGGLAELGYGFAYRVLDAQYFGLAQRRARVFVVGHLGDWRRAAAVLFERESLSGHPPPGREAGEAAPTLPSRSTAGGGLGTDFDCDGGLIPSTGDISHCLNAGGMGRIDYESETLIASSLPADHNIGARRDQESMLIAHALRADGFDASEDGTGRGTPIVPMVASGAHGSNGAGIGLDGDPMFTLDTTGAQAIAFDTTQITHAENRSNPQPGDPCHSLSAGAHPPAVAFTNQCGADSADVFSMLKSDCHAALPMLSTGMQVRRLTPRECERLQGFPDDYTLISYRGKLAKDGPRYKALGNSMAVPVMAWIGQRIALVDSLDV